MKKLTDNLEETLIAILICAMIVFETANAVLHAAGSEAVGIPQEIAIDCYIWIAFLSAAFCAKKGCDVAVTMLSDRYGASGVKIVKMICRIVNLLVSICLLIGAIIFLGNTAAAGECGKLTGIPLTIIYASSVVGYLLCTIRNIQSVLLSCRAEKNK